MKRHHAIIIGLLLLLLLFGWAWRERTKRQERASSPLLRTAVQTKAPSKRSRVPGCQPSGLEVCDGKDNDCDGQIDEGYTLACQPCPAKTGCIEARLAGGGWFAGKARNLLLGNDHGIELPPHPQRNQYIYIANSAATDGTVSKLRIADGAEVGRFYVGHNPSRTAVDGNGDAWVAMRGSIADHGKGKVLENVVKIDGRCVPKTKPPQSTRECILLDIPDVGNLLRGIAVDATGDVWVGAYETHEVIRLDGRTGLIRERIALRPKAKPYGLAVDERGFVWVAARSGKAAVLRIDPLSSKVDLALTTAQLRNVSPYGIAADGTGSIWFGSNGPWVFQVDARTGALRQSVVVGKQTRGVAIDDRGWLWAADSRQNAVLKISRKDGKVNGTYPVGKSPVGVAVDHDGHIWAVNLSSQDATKLSVDGKVLGTFPVGKHPYTYSDMTGSAYRVFKTLRGVFRAKYRTGLRGARWSSLRWEGLVAPKAVLAIRARAADHAKALSTSPWQQLSLQGQEAEMALRGAIIELEISLRTSQRMSTSFLDQLTFTLQRSQASR